MNRHEAKPLAKRFAGLCGTAARLGIYRPAAYRPDGVAPTQFETAEDAASRALFAHPDDVNGPRVEAALSAMERAVSEAETHAQGGARD